MFQRILVGLIFVAVGFLMVWKTDSFYRIFGRLPIGEKLFGSGGTRTVLKLFGVIIIIVGFFIITRFHERILEAIFGRIL